MKYLSVPVHNGDNATLQWLTSSKIKNFEIDQSLNELGFDSDLEVSILFNIILFFFFFIYI
jgi:hypothetical protein